MVAGLDIGGTRVKAGLVDVSGAVVRSATIPTPPALGAFREAVAELLARITGGEPVTGIGIGCKGIIRPADTFVETLPGTMDYLEGLTLAEFVNGIRPVHADNDARAALAGELTFGAATGTR